MALESEYYLTKTRVLSTKKSSLNGISFSTNFDKSPEYIQQLSRGSRSRRDLSMPELLGDELILRFALNNRIQGVIRSVRRQCNGVLQK